jgi:hypothetical protein
MHAIDSLFDDPNAPENEEDERDDQADDEDEAETKPTPSPAAARVAPAIPTPADGKAWRAMVAPLLEFVTKARTSVELAVWGARHLPRREGKVITGPVLDELVSLGELERFNNFAGKLSYRRPSTGRRARSQPTDPPPPQPSPPPRAAEPSVPPEREETDTMAKGNDWVGTPEAAALLGGHVTNLNYLAKRGRITSKGERRERLWSRESIEAYLAGKGETSRKSASPPPETGDRGAHRAQAARGEADERCRYQEDRAAGRVRGHRHPHAAGSVGPNRRDGSLT